MFLIFAYLGGNNLNVIFIQMFRLRKLYQDPMFELSYDKEWIYDDQSNHVTLIRNKDGKELSIASVLGTDFILKNNGNV